MTLGVDGGKRTRRILSPCLPHGLLLAEHSGPRPPSLSLRSQKLPCFCSSKILFRATNLSLPTSLFGFQRSIALTCPLNDGGQGKKKGPLESTSIYRAI